MSENSQENKVVNIRGNGVKIEGSKVGFFFAGIRPVSAEGEAGKTQYCSYWIQPDLVIGFSDMPLRIAIWMGLTVSALAGLYGLYVIGLWFTRSDLVQGWSSTVVVISFKADESR